MRYYEIYGAPESECCILRLRGTHEEKSIEEEISGISQQCAGKSWCMVIVPVVDWSNEMTPWATDDKTGGAAMKLREITDEVVQSISANYPNPDRRYIIAGYSLAGLFALWAAYESPLIDGVVAASPSVWYPHWIEYANDHRIYARNVYLSLGNKEHKTRNELMAGVKQCILNQKSLLDSQGINSLLEWNPGNHFNDVTGRMVKGITHIIQTYN